MTGEQGEAMSNRPAEVFPVGSFIAEELRAQRWTTAECAEKMGGDPAVNELALDILIHLEKPKCVVLDRDTADGLERALGVAAGTWLNLDRAYQEFST